MDARDFPDDYTSQIKFHRDYPDAHTSMDGFRWELRFRNENGLVACGAVIERFADPRATRPSLLISPSRYFHHLRSRARGAAA